MKAYVDTNILVDLILSRKQFLENAQRVFALGYTGDITLVVSALSFVNTVYLANKYKFPKDEVIDKLIQITEFTEIADLRGANIKDMLKSEWKDLEDATQHRCALESDADVIVTRNKKDFKDSIIPVITPQELFEKLSISF
ncbi:MAG: PIN domain-containing protein [Bacteroidaceae bacterium]|jgi:predicted nucleic acid-binding protein|nr:PIN domain-containing protein [Bacteroidaceae bacterium]